MSDVATIADELLLANRGLWPTAAWDAFCDCDELPDGIDYNAYLNWLDNTPLVDFRSVDDDDLEEPFAEERGICAGGAVFCLTSLGLAVRAVLIGRQSLTKGENA